MNKPDRYAILVEYLLSRVEERDWSGVSDAANDLRVMEAESPELRIVALDCLE